MDQDFNNQLQMVSMQGYIDGNFIQIKQNLISSAKAHLFLTDLTNKGLQDGSTKSNNTK